MIKFPAPESSTTDNLTANEIIFVKSWIYQGSHKRVTNLRWQAERGVHAASTCESKMGWTFTATVKVDGEAG
jgi:hypothetical protein